MHFPVVPEALGGSMQGKQDSLAAGEQGREGKGKTFPFPEEQGEPNAAAWAAGTEGAGSGAASAHDAHSLRLGTSSHRPWLVFPSPVCPGKKC